MARISFKGYEAFGKKLRELEFTAEGGKLLEDAAKAGVQPVADEIRNRLSKLPTEPFRRLRKPTLRSVTKGYRLSPATRTAWKAYASGDTFHSLSRSQLNDIYDGLGVTPVGRDKNGFVNCKVGFEGYGSFPTKTYPQGVPNALIARAVESGSSVRQKSPFVRPAVRSTIKKAIGEMDKVVTDGLKKIFKE